MPLRYENASAAKPTDTAHAKRVVEMANTILRRRQARRSTIEPAVVCAPIPSTRACGGPRSPRRRLAIRRLSRRIERASAYAEPQCELPTAHRSRRAELGRHRATCGAGVSLPSSGHAGQRRGVSGMAAAPAGMLCSRTADRWLRAGSQVLDAYALNSWMTSRASSRAADREQILARTPRPAIRPHSPRRALCRSRRSALDWHWRMNAETGSPHSRVRAQAP